MYSFPKSADTQYDQHQTAPGYFQPPAGSTESFIDLRPQELHPAIRSTYQALGEYQIRDFGLGLPAVAQVIRHIFDTKLHAPLVWRDDLWLRSVVVQLTCDLADRHTGCPLRDLDDREFASFSNGFLAAEGSERSSHILAYRDELLRGADLGLPLYLSGAVLNYLGATVDPLAIFMIDGARRIAASALARRESIGIQLIILEEEFSGHLMDPSRRDALLGSIGRLSWFNNYQSIPLVGVRGERTLTRFALMDMALLRDQTIMDFGCNLGQACIKGVMAGAREVWGVEGMADTCRIAQEIGSLSGFQNLHYLNVDFNAPDFDRQIDAACPDQVDYSFFFSVYRTKELSQRDALFRYIIEKSRKGIFFEGHADPAIDTIQYYHWLFESFDLTCQFLGNSEGSLRPLFFIPLAEKPAAQHPSSFTPDTAPQSLQHSPPPLTGGGRGMGEAASGVPNGAFPPTPTLPRKGGGGLLQMGSPGMHRHAGGAKAAEGAYVNIGMVTFNRLEFTREAIGALTVDAGFPYTLTVIDNNSQDGSRDYLLQLKEQGVIKNLVLLPENAGVAKASNLAWSLEPEADYYLKLDNDIVIQKSGWLKHMVDTIERIPLLGAVAYNFEPYSYPLQTVEGCGFRLKRGNLGGACILIPRRTRERLGVWCEDYGLYSEEDADYGRRLLAAGLGNAYLEDEQIGLHLPAGRAAAIDATTFDASDGVEETLHPGYRQWKDEQRRQAVGSGLLERNFTRYETDPSSLYVESQFTAGTLAQVPAGSLLPDTAGSLLQDTASPLQGRLPQREQAGRGPAGSTALRLKVAVYTTDGRNEACPQIRSLLPFRALSEQVELLWGVTWRPETHSHEVDRGLAAQADLVVITRFFPSPLHADFIEELLAGPVPVIYDTDDLLTGIDPENPFQAKGDDAAPHILGLMRRAALVTVSGEELKRQYAPFARRIAVLPNLLDENLWPAPAPKLTDGSVIIGYAGGFTHQTDLKIVEEALGWISQKYGDRVRFRFLGCATESLRALPGFEGADGTAGYQDFAGMLQKSEFDIAIAPLRDTPFNRCKSNVKWQEYSACGFAGVYSDLPPYQGSVEPGRTGLLVENTSYKWFAAIDFLIATPDLRRSMAAQARSKVLAEQTPAAQAWRYLEAYRSVLDEK